MNPTCTTCKFWKPEFEGSDEGECENAKVQIWTEHQQGPLWFPKDFGCIFHQPKQQSLVPTHEGFPPTNEDEVAEFWKWMDTKQAKGLLLPDEKHFLNHPHDKLAPGWLMERFRRTKE